MAYNAAGEGPESERLEERTYLKAPQKPPSSVHVYAINPSMVCVVWRYVSSAQNEEPIEAYKVRIWETDQNMITANNTIVPIGQKLESLQHACPRVQQWWRWAHVQSNVTLPNGQDEKT